jgi:hypothetical protein
VIPSEAVGLLTALARRDELISDRDRESFDFISDLISVIVQDIMREMAVIRVDSLSEPPIAKKVSS